MNLTGRFIIDGYDLYEAFKVVVQEAQGLDVLPKVKKRTEYDWPEESGVDVDATTDLTYEAHDITLDCYVQESTYADAVKRINGVVKLLSSDGFHLLGSQLRQRLYPVLLQEVTGYKRITPASSSSIFVQFTLKLRCPMPETRIGNVTVEADEEVALVIPTAKDFTVWWGDGTVNENTLTHTYTEAGTYTVLIAGTGVTSAVITGINVAEFSYPATGDIIHVDVSHTSEEAWQLAQSLLSSISNAQQTAYDAYDRATEAYDVAENAAATAGEAVQAIGEHSQATTNPHPTNTTQEFAEANITGLKSVTNDGTVSDTIYNWFKSVYSALVDGSVKSYIIGLLTVVKDLATRVGLLEDDYILKYVVPVNTTSIELTTDKYGNAFNFGIGERFKVYINGKSNTDESYAALYLQINNISTPQWLYAGSSVYPSILGYCCAYFTNIWDLEISTDSIQARLTSNRSNSALNNFIQNTLTLMSKPISIGGTIQPPVTSIKIITSYTIYAGSEIIIKTK